MPNNKGTSGRGDRNLKTRVKSARGRKTSSTRWLQRQLNDPYVALAKADGYRARAAYKLLEMDERFDFLRHDVKTVVDLGVAPGSWSQIMAKITGSTDEDPTIVGIDFLPVDPIPGVILLEKDFLDDDAPAAIHEALKGRPVDLVMSDMAAPTTGHRKTDHMRTTHLFEVAVDFAIRVLRPGGVFVAKTFRGGAESDLLRELKRDFEKVVHVKPPASRKESPELYMLATGFKGAKPDDPDTDPANEQGWLPSAS